VAEFFVSGQLTGRLRERRTQRMIDSYSDHVIVCGFGLGVHARDPYKTSGAEMARTALHPQIGGAVQVADYRLEEIEVPAACGGVGKWVQEVRGDAVIVAVRRTDGGLEPQPDPGSVVSSGTC
jgi:hypothetical protein